MLNVWGAKPDFKRLEWAKQDVKCWWLNQILKVGTKSDVKSGGG